MNLIFQNSSGEERIIANPKNREEMVESINAFVDECNTRRTDGKPFKIYYMRMYMAGNRMQVDCGSHSEFFFCELAEDETWESVNLSLR